MGIRKSSEDSEEKLICRLEMTPQCCVPLPPDSALGSPHWKSFKIENWANLRQGVFKSKNHSGLSFVKQSGKPVS